MTLTNAHIIAESTKTKLFRITRAAHGRVSDRFFARFTAFSFCFGIFVPIANERRVKRKFAEKLQNACAGQKKVVPLHSKVANFRSYKQRASAVR